MTCKTNSNVYATVLELLLAEGSAGFREALETLLNEAMMIERSRHLKAGPYERNDERQGYSNGFKSKHLKTNLGELSLSVPQVRDSDFYPSCLEKGNRVDRALMLTLAEMYIQGTSTRKVTKVVAQMCGLSVTSMEVSRAVSSMDDVFEKWRNREIGQIKYLYLDARYEKVRHGGSVVDCAVLIACGVNEQGMRKLLGISVSLSEHEVHWREFLESLCSRNMHGIELIISDAHSGLKAARKAVLPSVDWQRCQFHLQQNAQAYVPQKAMKSPVASKLRAIFNAENLAEAERQIALAVDYYKESAPRLSAWVEENMREGLTVFKYDESHRKKIRTTNMLERVNKEIKKRTRVAKLFPNEKSCCRLVTAILMEISEEWETGKRYIDFEK